MSFHISVVSLCSKWWGSNFQVPVGYFEHIFQMIFVHYFNAMRAAESFHPRKIWETISKINHTVNPRECVAAKYRSGFIFPITPKEVQRAIDKGHWAGNPGALFS